MGKLFNPKPIKEESYVLFSMSGNSQEHRLYN
jgi:hypothetical protein